jgi:hypothetical protein
MIGGVDWIGLAQFRERWRAAVDTVMNILGSAEFGELLE